MKNTLNKIYLFALLIGMIIGGITNANSQSIYNPNKKKYPAIGSYKPRDTVQIYNRVLVILSHPYAHSRGGESIYTAQAIKPKEKRFIPGKLYTIAESQIGKR